MSDFVIFVAGLVVLTLMTRVQPIYGWWSAFRKAPYLVAFALPLFTLLGWPIGEIESFREGSDLGWQRLARILLFGAFLLFSILKSIQTPRIAVPRLYSFGAFAIYSALCAISLLWSSEPLQTLWKALELFAMFMVAVQTYQVRYSPEERVLSVSGAIMFLSFAICVLSLIGGVLAPDRAWMIRDLNEGFASMGGVVPSVNPNTLAQLGGMVALLGVARLLSGSGAPSRGDLLVALVGGATLLAAYSRTSLFAFLGLLPVILFALRRSRTLVIGAVLAVLVSGIFLEQLTHYVARGQTGDQFASLTGRTYRWEAAMGGFYERPFLGHGFFVGHKDVLDRAGEYSATMDSTYVEVLVDLGVVGFAVIISFAVLISLEGWLALRKARLGPTLLVEPAVVFFITIGFAVVRSLTAASFQVLHYNLFFVLLAMTGVALIRRCLGQASAKERLI